MTRRKDKEKLSSHFLFCTLEHEAGLQREFQLEKGLLKGFKRVSSVLSKSPILTNIMVHVIENTISFFRSQKEKTLKSFAVKVFLSF